VNGYPPSYGECKKARDVGVDAVLVDGREGTLHTFGRLRPSPRADSQYSELSLAENERGDVSDRWSHGRPRIRSERLPFPTSLFAEACTIRTLNESPSPCMG
jgi:hypothetical protein